MPKKRKPRLSATGRDLQASWDAVLNRHANWPKFYQGPPPKPVQSIAQMDLTVIEARAGYGR